jgi:carbamoyltransferase
MGVVLGLNSHHAGSSAVLVIDGQPVAAIAEERLNRVKYYAGFPKLAIQKCMDMAGVKFSDVDAVAIGRDSSANLGKKIQMALRSPTRLLNLVRMKLARGRLDDLRTMIAAECEVDPSQMRFAEHHVEHHLAHIASAYFISPWEKAAGFSIDGSGDFVTVMLADCQGTTIDVKQRVYVPHSLGSFYTMLCEFIGYRKYGDEGKVMGLAPYGTDRYLEQVEQMVELTDDGMRLNPDYFMPFGATQGITIDEKGQMRLSRHYSDRVVEMYGPPHEPNTEISQREMDLAFAMQQVFEKAYFHLLSILHRLAPSERIVMAGGCALNSVANGKLFDHTPFRETCIQPAAGDEGLALGAALQISNAVRGEGKRYVMRNAYLGPEYNESQIGTALDDAGIRYLRCDRDRLLKETLDEIVRGNVVGWFQGRMEWGPRALGNRSILVHPGRPDMKDILNSRIKRREWFRPFAPVVLQERQSDIFEHTHPSPFMLHVYKIKPAWRERLVAVNHVDNTGRLQTVARDENPLYYDLIKGFEARTGLPVLLNTSFNENEPIVCTPSEAIDCFLRTRMDALVIGPFVCRKEQGTGNGEQGTNR